MDRVISQLKSLKAIKPAKDWAVLVKKDLLFEPIELKENLAKESFFAFFAKPAFVISSAVLIGCLIMGSLAYFGLQKSNYDLQAYIDSLTPQNEQNKVAMAGLADIQSKMDEVKTALEALKESNNPRQVLAAAEVVKATAKNSRTAIEQIKNSSSDLSKQTLASLTKIKEASVELETTSTDLQIEMFKSYLAELETKTLSLSDQERLASAEEYFNKGQVDEAILLLIKIGETAK
ncbi:MAG: hypothetical protein PHE77_00780 [Candidatus Pacebacteria bacterium]|nr:hypothetical protein [Candidatus Paceibacterota bacterium]